MGNTLTLDALREQIETKYGPFILEGFPDGGPIHLLPVLRLPRDQREQFSQKASELGGQENQSGDLNSSVDTIVDLLGLVCQEPKDIARIKKAVGDDGQMMLEIWSQYQEVTKLGNASPSES